jgi:hypothetical protein
MLATMVAISEPESGGNPRAHNPNASTGDNSYGPWQINMLGGMGPERRKEFGIASNEELFDPATNARAAKRILDSQGLGAWTTYSAGKHKPYMQQAEEAVARTRGQKVSPSTGSRPAAASSAPSAPAPVAASSNPLASVAQAGLAGLTDFSPAPAPAAGRAHFAQGGEFAKQLDEVTGQLMKIDERGRLIEDAPAAQPAQPSGVGRNSTPFELPTAGAVGLAAIELLAGKRPEVAATPAPAPVASPPAAPPATATSGKGEGSLSILDFGRKLRDNTGLKLAENAHPEFGGKVGGHSPNSLHYRRVRQADGQEASAAFDITDWRVPGEPESTWKPRKAALEQGWQGVAAQYPGVFEIYGPSSDPGGHGTHIHLGVRGDTMPLAAARQFLAVEQDIRRRFPLQG